MLDSASFSTAGYNHSLLDNVFDMNATGRSFWFSEADIATSEASHSTTKGVSSSMGARTTSTMEHFDGVKGFKGKLI